MKAKICKEVNCNTLINNDKIYCDKHNKIKIPFEYAKRNNESLYNTAQWRRLRKKIIAEGKCFKCGLETKELDTHHIKPPLGNEELFFDENNLIPVCKLCHRIITAKEIRNRKK